jgi:hypothetical protein
MMKLDVNLADVMSRAKTIFAPSYFTLIASVTAWIASIVLIMYPTIGVTTTVYPPDPTPAYQFLLLGITTCFASLYSAVMGYKLFKGEK